MDGEDGFLKKFLHKSHFELYFFFFLNKFSSQALAQCLGAARMHTFYHQNVVLNTIFFFFDNYFFMRLAFFM